jgi:hypothetical protein
MDLSTFRYDGILIQLLTFPIVLLLYKTTFRRFYSASILRQKKKHIQLDTINRASPYLRFSIGPFEQAFHLRTEAESSVRNVALYKTGELVMSNMSTVV